MNLFERIGIDIDIVVIVLAGILTIALVLVCMVLSKLSKMKKRYNAFMGGADGKTLESSVLNRFKEIDTLKEETKAMKEEIKKISENLLSAYQKCGIVKYDAFKEMGGKLSFSMCLLDDNNDGIILTSMHSSREGCYTYVKEIIKGESFVLLSEEERQALEEAKNKNNYLQ
ncbi:MAG: DUF4446 family protein [Clostridiales bacterium]|nr:DUF4446 family protein [Clostridiales bacterium]